VNLVPLPVPFFYAALARPLFHGAAWVRGKRRGKVTIKRNIKVKGVGQECPTHTSFSGIALGPDEDLYS
jgi:hypothetical protein